MSAILILGIGRIPSLPSPFYMVARKPANEKVVPPWRCRNGTTCLDATAVSGIAEEEAVLYWVHAFLPLCSTILHYYSEEETLSLFPTHLAFYWFPPRCHLIGCQDNKEGRGEDKTEEVTLLEGREEEETCFSLSQPHLVLSSPCLSPFHFLLLPQVRPKQLTSRRRLLAREGGGEEGIFHHPLPLLLSLPSGEREKQSGRRRWKEKRKRKKGLDAFSPLFLSLGPSPPTLPSFLSP